MRGNKGVKRKNSLLVILCLLLSSLTQTYNYRGECYPHVLRQSWSQAIPLSKIFFGFHILYWESRQVFFSKILNEIQKLAQITKFLCSHTTRQPEKKLKDCFTIWSKFFLTSFSMFFCIALHHKRTPLPLGDPCHPAPSLSHTFHGALQTPPPAAHSICCAIKTKCHKSFRATMP